MDLCFYLATAGNSKITAKHQISAKFFSFCRNLKRARPSFVFSNCNKKKKHWKQNLILLSLIESDRKENLKRKNHDIELVNEMLRILEVEVSFGRVMRLGRKLEDGGNRPLIITFNSEHDVRNILDNLYKLKDADVNLKRVKIIQDKGRQARKKLRN